VRILDLDGALLGAHGRMIMNYVKNTIGTIVAALFLSGCVCGEGNGIFESETRKLPTFVRVESDAFVEVRVQVGTEQSVLVTGDSNLLHFYETEVDGDTLKITVDGIIMPSIEPAVIITVPELWGADVSGTGDVVVKNLDGAYFHADVSGTGDLRLSGLCDTLEAEVSGTGSLNARNLACHTVILEVSGTGGAVVHASEEIDAEISGVGNADVYGNPCERTIDVSGVGNLSFL